MKSNSNFALDESKAEKLLQKAIGLKQSDLKKSLALAMEACELFEKNLDFQGQTRSLFHVGECCVFLSRFAEALEMLQKAESLIKEDISKDASDVYNLMGNAFFYQGNNKQSLVYHEKAFSIRERMKDLKGISASLNNIGLLHQRGGDFASALDYHFKSLQIKEENGFTQSIWASMNNIGEIYQELGEYSEALNFHFNSLEQIQNTGNTKAEWTVLINIGLCYKGLGDFENALECLMKSLIISENSDDLHGKLISVINLGDHFLSQGDTEVSAGYYRSGLILSREIGNTTCEAGALHGKGIVNYKRGEFFIALDYLKSALKIANDQDLKLLQFNIHKALSDCYEALNKTKAALKHFKLFHQIKQEVHSENTGKTFKNFEYRQKLAQSNKEIEIQRLKSIKLVDSLERLRFLMNSKNEFLGIVTHDLKNPLFGIQGLASLIISDFDRMSAEDIIDCAINIRNSSNQMFDLIRNLLEMESIENGKMHLEIASISIREIFLKTNSLFFHIARDKDIKLDFKETDEDLFVMADKHAICQILDNLVSNAIKFSPAKTRVEVAIEVASDKILIRVKDQGPGLSAADHKKLFTKFTKLSARPTGGENSTGLGLSISKQLAELMQGKISCESEKNKGAIFILELPKA